MAQTTARFGTVFSEYTANARFEDGQWTPWEVTPLAPLQLHPGSHVLHYSSAIFEGFKVYKQNDGNLCVFRIDAHIARMQQSARLLFLPEPPADMLRDMTMALARKCEQDVPEYPGSLYIRPNLIGTDVDVGAAALPSSGAQLVITACPVGDYFSGGMRPLKVLIEETMRTAAHLGVVKAGANYASGLYTVLQAKKTHGADQVLFCPDDDVQETGAANFMLFRDDAVLTKNLDETFLHGVTRDSLLQLATDKGMRVEQRKISVSEMLDWIKTGEAALSGTAAVLAGVGTIIHQDQEHTVNGGEIGPVTRDLRESLMQVQAGALPDTHGWITAI